MGPKALWSECRWWEFQQNSLLLPQSLFQLVKMWRTMQRCKKSCFRRNQAMDTVITWACIFKPVVFLMNFSAPAEHVRQILDIRNQSLGLLHVRCWDLCLRMLIVVPKWKVQTSGTSLTSILTTTPCFVPHSKWVPHLKCGKCLISACHRCQRYESM